MFGRKSNQSSADGPAGRSAAETGSRTQDVHAPEPRLSDTEGKERARDAVRQSVYNQIDPGAAAGRSREDLQQEIRTLVVEAVESQNWQLNWREQTELADAILDDITGVGPIEPLMHDERVTDILVNGPYAVYAEIEGQLRPTRYAFRGHEHLFTIAQRIAARVGRRVDESSPMVDARLFDGSRVNVVIPPLALDGVCISIRKFGRHDLTLTDMARQGNLNDRIAQLLDVAANCQLNMLVSGGTGSGKTTLLNAISRCADPRERIVTIEDIAELSLQQPHVVRLETRPANIEGEGRVAQDDLLRNALRMRPDRIIVGEVRGAEAFTMLQAMNTGHDGSLSTLHANSPREALGRLENMMMMGNANLPASIVRSQIVRAVDLVVQVERMRDGKRRVTNVSEVAGQEDEIITMRDLFWFEQTGFTPEDGIRGEIRAAGGRPGFAERAEALGLGDKLAKAVL